MRTSTSCTLPDSPEGQSLQQIMRKIPGHCFNKPLSKSLLFLLRDFALLVAVVALVLTYRTWVVGVVGGAALGVILTGLFVIGHDCGHRSFSRVRWINDLVGELTITLTLWPFHVWRLSHDIHHRFTHHIERDIAWVPFTQAKLDRLGPVSKTIYKTTRTGLFWIGSMFFTFYFIKDALRGKKSRHFNEADRPQLRRSLIVTAVYAVTSLTLILWTAGFYGFICLFVLPQIGFHVFLSTFTYLHHTHPEKRFMAATEWTPEKAQLGSTQHVNYPWAIDFFTNDISWHVPHHVCVGIPHYHLREAHEALKTAYPDIVREQTFSFALLAEITNQCQVVGSKHAEGLGWRSFGTPHLLEHQANS